MSSSRVVVVGASGWIGGHVLREARERGHEVTGVGRAVADITDQAALASVLRGHDAVVGAYRAPSEQPREMLTAARSLIAAAREAEVERVVWTGSTAVLQLPGGGGALVDLPQFPAEWKPSGLAHRETLETFRREADALAWTYIAPPRTIEEGERSATYRVQEDEFLVDEQGESRISVQDFAVAIVDLVESGDHARSCVTVAY